MKSANVAKCWNMFWNKGTQSHAKTLNMRVGAAYRTLSACYTSISDNYIFCELKLNSLGTLYT